MPEKNNPEPDEGEGQGQESGDDKSMEDLQEELNDLKEQNEKLQDAVDPNYKKLRKKANRADEISEQLQEKGFKVDGEGNVIEADEAGDSLSEEEAERLAEEKAVEVNVRREKQSQLSDIKDDETREAVKDVYESLTQDKDVDIDNVDKYMKMAKRAANANESNDTQTMPSGYSGRGPRTGGGDEEGDDFGQADTDEGEERRRELFGDDYIPEDQV